ncbi:MAG: CRP-like cAMP-binding protein [Gammaproteobacteria bacterium]|jgi:CRP-like cAMP-binding protein
MSSSMTITPEELHRLSLFKSTQFDDIEDVLIQASVLRVDAGRIVIAAGQPNKRLYIVIEGRLQVRLDSLDNPPVARISEGEMFGELSVIDGEYTSAFVVTETPCRIMGLDGEVLWELFKRTPYVAHNLLSMLAKRLRNSNKVIESLQGKIKSG